MTFRRAEGAGWIHGGQPVTVPGVEWVLPIPPPETPMKVLIPFACAALLAAGCATDPSVQVAQRECKTAPITTTSVTGKARPMSDIERRAAEMDLARSPYRFQNLARNGIEPNLVEDTLRDCY
jgi:PBP1b-binding outer membrane lipoprotein LpoB